MMETVFMMETQMEAHIPTISRPILVLRSTSSIYEYFPQKPTQTWLTLWFD